MNKHGQRTVHKQTNYFFYHIGISTEGIFRVNGNGRIVDKLRASFEKTGDADLDAVLDVMSVAGLLKLFLRELPEGVVPEENTKLFVRAQQGKGEREGRVKEDGC